MPVPWCFSNQPVMSGVVAQAVHISTQPEAFSTAGFTVKFQK